MLSVSPYGWLAAALHAPPPQAAHGRRPAPLVSHGGGTRAALPRAPPAACSVTQRHGPPGLTCNSGDPGTSGFCGRGQTARLQCDARTAVRHGRCDFQGRRSPRGLVVTFVPPVLSYKEDGLRTGACGNG